MALFLEGEPGGDIFSFGDPTGDDIFVHLLVGTGSEEEGWLCIGKEKIKGTA